MSEQLLSIDQVAMRLSISKSHTENILPELMVKGLQRVIVSPRCIRFREASLDKLIKKAAERESSLFDKSAAERE